MDVHAAKDLDADIIYDECLRFYKRQTFMKGIKEFILGFIAKENSIFEKELNKFVQCDLYADAADSTFKHTFAKNKGEIHLLFFVFQFILCRIYLGCITFYFI